MTATLTTFQIDGVYFLLSQLIAKAADGGSTDKMKKSAASLALVVGGKAVASAPTAKKEAASAKPAATPAPAKPAATEAPAVASAKPSAASKPSAAGETVPYPKENPILSFKKPSSWLLVLAPDGSLTVGTEEGIPNLSFAAIAKDMSDADLQAMLKKLTQAMAENGPTKGFKVSAMQDAVLGPFKGSVIELSGELPGVGKLIERQHVLRNAKGKAFLCAVASAGPLDAEARAVVDSLTSQP